MPSPIAKSESDRAEFSRLESAGRDLRRLAASPLAGSQERRRTCRLQSDEVPVVLVVFFELAGDPAPAAEVGLDAPALPAGTSAAGADAPSMQA